MSMTEANLTNLLTIQNGNLRYAVQNERYASSGVSVLISFARVPIVSVSLPFLQSHRQRKMAARFILHGDHLTKVVLSGTPLLRPVQYDRTFLDSVQYGNLLNVFTNAIWMEQFFWVYNISHYWFCQGATKQILPAETGSSDIIC